MSDTHILHTILESARALTAKYRVSGPFGIQEATPSIMKLDDWSMTQVANKIKSFIGKFNDQQQLRVVEPHAYERGYRAGENNSPLTNNVMVNFNKLGTEQKRIAFCAGWAATFNNVDTLKESNCPACDEELEEEVVTVYEEDGITRKGKKVILNKPHRTPEGPKKFAVYVRNDKGNIQRVSFGDPKMEIKRDNPKKRKAYRSRHGCDNPGPKWKANYWSCRMWGRRNVSDITEMYTDKKRMCKGCFETIPTGAKTCKKCGAPVGGRGGPQVMDQQKCSCGHTKMKHDEYGCTMCPCKKFAANLSEEEQLDLFGVDVVILDQFYGPSPYQLKKQPMKWEEFVKNAKAGEYSPKSGYWRKAEFKRVPDNFSPDMATTVYRKGANGNVEVWKYKWDTSG